MIAYKVNPTDYQQDENVDFVEKCNCISPT